MGLIDKTAQKLGFQRLSSIDTRVRQDSDGFPETGPQMAAALTLDEAADHDLVEISYGMLAEQGSEPPIIPVDRDEVPLEGMEVDEFRDFMESVDTGEMCADVRVFGNYFAVKLWYREPGNMELDRKDPLLTKVFVQKIRGRTRIVGYRFAQVRTQDRLSNFSMTEQILSDAPWNPTRNPDTDFYPYEVIHLKGRQERRQPWMGHCPLERARKMINYDDELVSFSLTKLRKKGDSSGIISPKEDDEMGPDELNAAKSSVRSQSTGENRGDYIVLPKSVELQKGNPSLPQEYKVTDQLGAPEGRVLGVFGVPRILTYISMDGATFSNVDGARLDFIEKTIKPLWRRIQKQLTEQLWREFSLDGKLMFDLSDIKILQEDLNKKHERIRQDVAAGLVGFVEGREMMNLNEPDADEKFVLPQGVQVTTFAGYGVDVVDETTNSLSPSDAIREAQLLLDGNGDD